MKNLFRIVFIAILALAVFCGCSSDEPVIEENFPEEIPGENWDRDPFEHWQNGDTGEKLNSGEHKIGDEFSCIICGSQITDWGDGSYNVDNYDENYNILRSTYYETDGSVYDYVTEYEYDAYGNIVASKEYENGELCLETEYVTDSDGNRIPSYSVSYFDNGHKTETEYNENGEIILERSYSPETLLYLQNAYEYAVSEDGSSYQSAVITTDQIEERIFEYLYNEQSDCVSYTEYDFYETVLYTETTEYKYFEDGWKSYKSTKINGLPSEEIYFGVYDDGEGSRWTYYEKQIVYNEDGSYTVFEYDENDELLSETSFDADGNEI